MYEVFDESDHLKKFKYFLAIFRHHYYSKRHDQLDNIENYSTEPKSEHKQHSEHQKNFAFCILGYVIYSLCLYLLSIVYDNLLHRHFA